MQNQIFIITGAQGEGKTSRCLELVNQLKEANESVGGIVARGYWRDNTRSGFDLVNISTLETLAFATREIVEDWFKIKAFYFNPDAIAMGESTLRKACLENDWIVLDEIGNLDIKGAIWSSIFTDLIRIPNKKWILTVRDIFVEDIIRHWQLKNVKVLKIEDAFEY